MFTPETGTLEELAVAPVQNASQEVMAAQAHTNQSVVRILSAQA